jgi:hypothetical protein
MTFIKGRKLIENGKVLQDRPTGKYLKCGTPIIPA